MEEKKNSNKILVVIASLLLLVCIGLGCYIGYNKFSNKETSYNDTRKTEGKNQDSSKTNKEETTGLTQEEIAKGCVICDSEGGKCCPTQ